MKKSFRPIDIQKVETDIICSAFLDDTERILVLKAKGTYRRGSIGNGDANFIYINLVTYYFWVEPQVLILDISELEYTWGNTMLNIIFFLHKIGRDDYEKSLPMYFIVSEKNKEGLCSLLHVDTLPSNFFNNIEDAITKAESELEYDDF
jgi:hypothetical protein